MAQESSKFAVSQKREKWRNNQSVVNLITEEFVPGESFYTNQLPLLAVYKWAGKKWFSNFAQNHILVMRKQGGGEDERITLRFFDDERGSDIIAIITKPWIKEIGGGQHGKLYNDCHAMYEKLLYEGNLIDGILQLNCIIDIDNYEFKIEPYTVLDIAFPGRQDIGLRMSPMQGDSLDVKNNIDNNNNNK